MQRESNRDRCYSNSCEINAPCGAVLFGVGGNDEDAQSLGCGIRDHEGQVAARAIDSSYLAKPCSIALVSGFMKNESCGMNRTSIA